MKPSRYIERGSGAPEKSAGPTSWITAAYGSYVHARHMKIQFKKAANTSAFQKPNTNRCAISKARAHDLQLRYHSVRKREALLIN